ncbi:MAG: double-stranded DNA-binding protein [Thaumarchaeota archaeon]|nr:double-stranded DNA-binding protein [Nitrososphaerota archaeon]
MSEEDKDLEALKQKRLAEMQKNISYKKKQEELKSSLEEKKKSASSPREIVVKQLGYRGLEVLENAETQFPSQTKFVIGKLAELISSGEINETLDGGKLLALFRAVGVNVRLETKINIEQDGKFVSLSDKLSKSTQPSNDAES